MAMGDPIEETSLGRYHWWYVGSLVAATVLIGCVRAYFNVSVTGVLLITPFLAATVASDRFVIREQRVPSEDERKRLTFGHLAIFILINALVLLGFVSGGGLDIVLSQMNATIETFMAIFMSFLMAALVLNYLLIRWSYGGIARKRAQKLGFLASNDN